MFYQHTTNPIYQFYFYPLNTTPLIHSLNNPFYQQLPNKYLYMLSLGNNNYNINTNTQHQPNALYFQHQWNNTTQQLQPTPIIPEINFNTTNNEHIQLPSINENSDNALQDNSANITPITVPPIKKGMLIDYYIYYIIYIFRKSNFYYTKTKKRQK